MKEFNKSLEILRQKGRFRARKYMPMECVDFASNDYLGFKKDFCSFERAYKKALECGCFAPSASQLVYGYADAHKRLEERIKRLHPKKEAITVGSGYLANNALVGTLAGHRDLILMDEEYHASGISALKLSKARFELFRHNDADDLAQRLKNARADRIFVFVESVYSMIGDVLDMDIISLADEYGAYLVVDEAHGFGVIGDKLGGIYDFYGLMQGERHIKMGTLSKAVGSYGAYIVADKAIIDFLINRAKPIIYSTALSPFDALLAAERIKKIAAEAKTLRQKLDKRLFLCREIFQTNSKTPIFMIQTPNAIKIHSYLEKRGVFTGLIRPPTVQKASIRLIARVGESLSSLAKTANKIKGEL